MSTPALLSAGEYLHTVFDGADREYLDGEVVERNMGNKSHGRAQGRFVFVFSSHEAATGIFTVPELRHRVTPTRYRIPDVAVFASEPADEVPGQPPLVAIEVLSPDDRMSDPRPKLEEYRLWGVPHIWVADPERRAFYTYGAAGIFA